jgi:hypothetical protein
VLLRRRLPVGVLGVSELLVYAAALNAIHAVCAAAGLQAVASKQRCTNMKVSISSSLLPDCVFSSGVSCTVSSSSASGSADLLLEALVDRVLIPPK